MERQYNLDRFAEAQQGIYPVALRELQQGRKRSHWMWYIFPQMRGLGRTYNSNYYGIIGLGEAAAYLAHPILGPRIMEVSETILSLPGDDAAEVFGHIDAMKLRSSMTLFDAALPGSVFARVLDKYFADCRDQRTLRLIDNHS